MQLPDGAVLALGGAPLVVSGFKLTLRGGFGAEAGRRLGTVAGATLDAEHLSRHFTVNFGGELELASIQLINGASAEQSGSIHVLGAKLQNLPSCNGWTFWHVEKAGKTLVIDELRSQIRAENDSAITH